MHLVSQRRFQTDVHNAQDLLDQNHSVTNGLYHILHVLTCERWDTERRYALLKLGVQWLQLFLLLVLPHYGWDINTGLWLWEAIEWLQFRIPIAKMVRQPSTIPKRAGAATAMPCISPLLFD